MPDRSPLMLHAGPKPGGRGPHGATLLPLAILAAAALALGGCSTGAGARGGGAGGGGRKVAAKECVACHAATLKQQERKLTHKPFADAKGCESCHRRHGIVGVNVLQKEEPELCFGCHEKQKKEFGQGVVHEAIRGTGKAKCTSCHAAHASDLPSLMRVSTNEACATCHKKAQLQGAKVHAPAAKDCGTCHTPHASPQKRLLVKEEKALCGGCHEAGDARMKKAHGGLPVASASCVQCHSPHSAAAAGGLLPSVHAVGSDCAECHTGGSDKAKPFAVKKAAPELCFGCHDAQQADLKKKVVHPPAEGCTDCHSPHAAKGPKLLVQGVRETCAGCHEPIAAKLATRPHAPARDGKCASCHAPHGSDNKRLLVATGPALCTGCHQAAAEWLKAKVVHAPARSGDCGGCHDPHGSPNGKLLVKGAGELCYGCHQKQKEAFTGDNLHRPVREGQCAACHQPHGSAQAKLLNVPAARLCDGCHAFDKRYEKTKLHAPLASGGCSACHDPHVAGQPKLLKSPVASLCAGCHEKVPKGLDAKGIVSSHRPVRNGECTACHEPHGSKDKAFLKKGRLEVCGDCHGELVKRLARRDAPSHAPARDGDCDACHAGHASAQPSLLLKAGKQLCLECHDAKDAALVKTHSGYDIDGSSCLGCHDPHYGDRKGLIRRVGHSPFVNRDCGSCHVQPKPGGSEPKTVASGRALCEVCHGDTRTSFAKKFVHTAVKQERCGACHAPHASSSDKLLSRTGGALCYTCHDPKAFQKKEMHAPVKAGECLKCHYPHASDAKGVLVRTGNELCLGCHAEQKRELASKHVHAAVTGGACTDCHDPHGSPYPAMLVSSREKLCLKCHDTKAPAIQAAHQRFPLAGVDCASCHNPHGSSQAGLIRSNKHQVFGACARCHATTGAKPQALLAQSPALCFRCHGDKKTEVSAKTGVHAAAQGDCTDCHTPHASNEKGLVKGNKERAVCLGCHDGIKGDLERSKSIHPVKAAGGRCTACHRPHSSSQVRLLSQPAGELCQTCHKTHAQFTHPIGKGVTDPNTGKDMNCLSCHGPHGTSQDHILLGNPARGLCIRCHDADSEDMKGMRKPKPAGPAGG